MTTILVLYASHFGQTRRIAEAIADELRLDHHVTLADVAGPDVPSPGSFDAVILGSRIETGKHAPAVRAYIDRHRVALHGKPTAYFAVSMAAAAPDAGPDPSGYLAALCDELDWAPSLRVAFGGALRYREYNWFLRWMMKRISRSKGLPIDTKLDYEFTDWKSVRKFAIAAGSLVTARRGPDAPRNAATPPALGVISLRH